MESMPSSSSNLDDSDFPVSEKDKEKYEYLSEYFVLESVKAGTGKARTLYFKCQHVECNTKAAKSCQESSMSNLQRHYQRCHTHVSADFDKVYYKKAKLKRPNSENGNDNNLHNNFLEY